MTLIHIIAGTVIAALCVVLVVGALLVALAGWLCAKGAEEWQQIDD